MADELVLKHLKLQSQEAEKWYKIWRGRATDALRKKDSCKRNLAKEKIRFWVLKLIQTTSSIKTIELLEASHFYIEQTVINSKKGIDNSSSKLTEDQVRLIRGRGKSDDEYAKEFNVSLSTVYSARTGKSWKQVK